MQGGDSRGIRMKVAESKNSGGLVREIGKAR